MIATTLETDLLNATLDARGKPDLYVKNSEIAYLVAREAASNVQLAPLLDDIVRDAELELRMLRLDHQANRFKIQHDDEKVNLLVGRMVIPSGSTPGRYDLEFASFVARPAAFPDWFPVVAKDFHLSIGRTRLLSPGFSFGQGSVMFSELLSTRNRVETQSFGVVFLDRLTSFYNSITSPTIATLLGEESTETRTEAERELAFLAHEWGHLSSPVPLALDVPVQDRRLTAILEEEYADLAAIRMLSLMHRPEATRAIATLVHDRIARDAWLPEPGRQIAAIAGRHLLRLIAQNDLLDLYSSHVNLAELERQLKTLRTVLTGLLDNNAEIGKDYLANAGWSEEDGRYSLSGSYDLEQLLRTVSSSRGGQSFDPCSKDISEKNRSRY